jgi:tol-pal system protein YbgF
LSAQMGEIMRRLQRMEQRSGGLAPGPGGSRQAQGPDAAEQGEQGTGFSISGDDKDSGGGGFGTSIEPRPGENSGRANSGGQTGNYGGQPSGGYSGQPSGGYSGQPGGAQGNSALSSSGPDSGGPVRTAASSTPQARALYDQAYNALVQRNYRAASNDFEQFVQSYSSDPLAGSAYFWLGEASFTSGEYRKAADSFLKSSTNYPQNEKAAESLLKLGISLKRLGENKAACSSFAELARRFPSATPVLQRAEREKSRAQC